MRGVTVLGVPTSAGAHVAGQERAPDALRRAGLLDLLGNTGRDVRDLGDLPVVRWTPDRTNPRAQRADVVAQVAERVAGILAAEVTDAKEAAHETGGEPNVLLVLGGDCTIEAGVISGFKRAGERVGLIYFDAGPDLNTPASIREGFLDWMGMAHVLGVPGATRELGELGPDFPLLEPVQVVMAGIVPDEQTDFERQTLEQLAVPTIWTDQVAADPLAAANQALELLQDYDRVLLHFDVDVVDFLDFPAADFPTINAGVTLEQALAFIAAVARDPRLAAVTVCEINPDHLDEEGALIQQFAQRLVESLPI